MDPHIVVNNKTNFVSTAIQFDAYRPKGAISYIL